MKNITIKSAEQISSYLSRLRLESRKITVRAGLFETNGMVIDASTESVSILYQGSFSPTENFINLQFMLGGDYFFGQAKILSNDKKTLTVSLPEELENRTIRKYPRVFVKEQVFARFHIITDMSNQDKEINTASAPPKLASIYFELQKNVPDIKKVLTMVASEIKNIAEISEIKLHKAGDALSDEINTVKKFKLPFWISSTDNIKNFVKEVPTNDVVNFSQFLKEKKAEGWNNDKIRGEIVLRQAQYIQQQIYSIIYVPITLLGNVVGHITAQTTNRTMKALHLNDVYYIKALADVVSEALAKARLFKLDSGSAYDVSVINLSAGGAYFEINSPYIIKFLHEQMRLNLGLKIAKKEIGVISEIRRIDFLGDKVRVALQFLEIAAESQRFIEDFVRTQIGSSIAKGHITPKEE